MEAAFFALDKTVIAKASMVAFSGPLHRAGLLPRRTLLRAAWGQLVYSQFGASPEKLAKLRDSVLRLTVGWDQAEIGEIVRETLALRAYEQRVRDLRHELDEADGANDRGRAERARRRAVARCGGGERDGANDQTGAAGRGRVSSRRPRRRAPPPACAAPTQSSSRWRDGSKRSTPSTAMPCSR